ncbi:hypothetical protein D3C74_315120 [compost metagenome]
MLIVKTNKTNSLLSLPLILSMVVTGGVLWTTMLWEKDSDRNATKCIGPKKNSLRK